MTTSRSRGPPAASAASERGKRRTGGAVGGEGQHGSAVAAAVHGAMEEASRQIRSVNGHGKLKLVHLIPVRKIKKQQKSQGSRSHGSITSSQHHKRNGKIEESDKSHAFTQIREKGEGARRRGTLPAPGSMGEEAAMPPLRNDPRGRRTLRRPYAWIRGEEAALRGRREDAAGRGRRAAPPCVRF